VTQVLLSSSLYSTATLAAACEAGTIPAPSSGQRVLMVANNSLFPEINADIDEIPGFAAIAGIFDRVVHFNDFIHPYHPSEFKPRDDLHFWESYARHHFDLHDDIELAVESIQVRPAQTVAGIFMGSPITVYAEGLMSYGPTRNQLNLDISERIDQVVYPDLLGGLRPVLLREFEVPYRPFDADALKKVFAQMASVVQPNAAAIDGLPLVVGQYLSALAILTPEAELDLHLEMVRAAAGSGSGSGRVCFKPHPGAPPAATFALADRAALAGIELVPVLDDNPLEVLLSVATPSAIISAFSTALITAGRLYGVPVGCVGTDLLLEELTPYENSNRVPVTIIDYVVPHLSASVAPAPIDDRSFDVANLQALVETVGYCMQPDRLPMLRPQAEKFLRWQSDTTRRRYVKRRRLTALALPGAPYVPLWKRLALRYRNTPIMTKVRIARRRLADGSLKPVDLPRVALKSLRGKH